MQKTHSVETLVGLIQSEPDPRRLSALVNQLCALIDKQKLEKQHGLRNSQIEDGALQKIA